MKNGVTAHLQTWRPYTLAYPGLVGLAGAALAGADRGWPLLLAAWAAPTLGWLAGHYLGDYFDRDLDAISKPHRPIPSGRLSGRAALVSGGVCLVLLTALVATVNWRALALVVAALAGIVGYSRLFKGRGVSGNLVRGLLTALALVCGAMLTTPLPPWQVLPFAVVFCAHDCASNLVGTLRDIDGDRAGGYQTVPVRHGSVFGTLLAVTLYASALLLAGADSVLVPGSVPGYLGLLVLAAGFGVAAFAPLLRTATDLKPRTALRAHEVLVVERLVLAGAVLAGGLGLLPALAVLLPVVLFSVLSQHLMRARYEFGAPEPENGRRHGHLTGHRR